MARRDARIDGILDALANVGEIFERQAQANGGNGGGAANQIERFMKLKPSKFEGTGNPEEAEKWIDGLETRFAVLNSSDAEKVTLAEYQLEGSAKHWWKATRGVTFPEGTELQWAEFVKVFYGKFFSDCARDKKVTEFTQLTQKGLTVDQYEAKFAELSRFAPRLIEHPEDKAKKFLNGLKHDIRKQLVPFNLKDYDDVYARAQLVEQELARTVMEGNSSRSFVPGGHKRMGSWKKPNPRFGKKQNFGGSYRGGSSNQGNRGGFERRWEAPRSGPVKCFQCGQTGHIKRFCPQLGNGGRPAQAPN